MSINELFIIIIIIMNKKILIVISSKDPSTHLLTNLKNINEIQCTDSNSYDILCVDSDSNDFRNYEKAKVMFPKVIFAFIKNKNYEYGAWKYAYETYPFYEIYYCIQDTLIIKSHINLEIVNDVTSYTYHHNR